MHDQLEGFLGHGIWRIEEWRMVVNEERFRRPPPLCSAHVSDEVDRSRRRVVDIVKFCEASATNPLAPHSKRAARCFGGGRGEDQGFPRPKCLSLSSLCTLHALVPLLFLSSLAMASRDQLIATTKSNHIDMGGSVWISYASPKSITTGKHSLMHALRGSHEHPDSCPLLRTLTTNDAG